LGRKKNLEAMRRRASLIFTRERAGECAGKVQEANVVPRGTMTEGTKSSIPTYSRDLGEKKIH